MTKRFPDEDVHLFNVRRDERNAQMTALEGKNIAAEQHTGLDYIREKERVRTEMKRDRKLTYEERGCAFTPLNSTDRGILGLAMDEYLREGRYATYTALNLNPWVEAALRILRVNKVAGKIIVGGALFRNTTTELFKDAMQDFMGFVNQRLPCTLRPEEIAVVMPLRAGLAGAMAFHEFGVRNFGAVGIARHEKTANPEDDYYAVRIPLISDLTKIYVISDPMLATAGSLESIILWLMSHGVPEERIVCQCVVAAPEGVDRILQQYRVRIFAMAQDAGLNSNAFIEGVGIGDFGDLYFNEMTRAEMEKAWLARGITGVHEIDAIIRRTEAIAGPSHGA